jgi:hypothetical protein
VLAQSSFTTTARSRGRVDQLSERQRIDDRPDVGWMGVRPGRLRVCDSSARVRCLDATTLRYPPSSGTISHVLAPVFGLIAVCIRPLPGGARRERSERLGMRERRPKGAASRAADHRKAGSRAL